MAVPFLDGAKCSARLIRLSPGQALPLHKHEPSELMLFVAEGDAELETEDGSVPFFAGSLARSSLRLSRPAEHRRHVGRQSGRISS